ncbi:hypothetical protein [Pasteuria penetrans]|uniref:hypothetical protein n=1 Tax=Pasteuria penetrans TaxID=86005 RepID=UPI000FC17D51|nr:hypothetical protein [Pasteuria penetrans]
MWVLILGQPGGWDPQQSFVAYFGVLWVGRPVVGEMGLWYNGANWRGEAKGEETYF